MPATIPLATKVPIAGPLYVVESTGVARLRCWRDTASGEMLDISKRGLKRRKLTVGRSLSVFLGRYHGADVSGTVLKHNACVSFAVVQ